jgi:hypothetical protein
MDLLTSSDDDLKSLGRFHGIFCLASLFHIPKKMLLSLFQRVGKMMSIENQTILFTSFPIGHHDDDEKQMPDGRQVLLVLFFFFVDGAQDSVSKVTSLFYVNAASSQ